MILNRIEFEGENTGPYDLVPPGDGRIPPQYDVFGTNPIEKEEDSNFREKLLDLTESLSKLPAPARAILLAALITISPNYNNNYVVYANESRVPITVPSTPNPYDPNINPLENYTPPQFNANVESALEQVNTEQVEKEPNYKITDYVLVFDGEVGYSFEPLDSIDSIEAEIIKKGASSVLPFRIRYRPEGESDVRPPKALSVHISEIEDHGKLSRIYGYTAAHAISDPLLNLRGIEVLGQKTQAKFTSLAENPTQASRGDDNALLSAWIYSDQIPRDLHISPELSFESIDEAREFLTGEKVYVSGFPARVEIQEDYLVGDVRLTVPAVVVGVEEGFNGMFDLKLQFDDNNFYEMNEFDFSGMSGATVFISCGDDIYSVATCRVASYRGRRKDSSSGSLVLAGTTYPPTLIGTNETSTAGWFEMLNNESLNYDPKNLMLEDLVPFMVHEYPQDIEAIGNILSRIDFNLRAEEITYKRAYLLDTETKGLRIEFNSGEGLFSFVYNPESKSLEHVPNQ